jgi:hypothetical protein
MFYYPNIYITEYADYCGSYPARYYDIIFYKLYKIENIELTLLEGSADIRYFGVNEHSLGTGNWTIPDEWNVKGIYIIGYGANPYNRITSINGDYMYVRVFPYSDYVKTNSTKVDYALMFTMENVKLEEKPKEEYNYYGEFKTHIYLMSRKEEPNELPRYSIIDLTQYTNGLTFKGYIKALSLDKEQFVRAVANYLEEWFWGKNYGVLTEQVDNLTIQQMTDKYAIRVVIPYFLFYECGGKAYTGVETTTNTLRFDSNEAGKILAQEYDVILDANMLRIFRQETYETTPYGIVIPYEERRVSGISLIFTSSGIITLFGGIIGMIRGGITVGGRM